MKTNIISYAGSGFTVLTGMLTLSIDEIKSIILLVLGVISGLLAISLSVYKWYKEASKDGKITAEEIKEGVEILANGIEDIKENVGKEEKKDGNKDK